MPIRGSVASLFYAVFLFEFILALKVNKVVQNRVLQQDNAPTHLASDTVELQHRQTHEFNPNIIASRNTVDYHVWGGARA